MNTIKKYVLCLFVFSILMFVGCSSSNVYDKYYNSSSNYVHTNNTKSNCTVNFFVDNVIYRSIKIRYSEQVKKPENPSKENYIFLHWCTDLNLSKEYDFTDKVYGDINLYANFIIDASSITSEITKTYIRSVFTVMATSSKTEYENWDVFKLFGKTYQSTGQGSGVCFSKGNGVYYLLTNCHVAKMISSYSTISYTVEDYKGNKFTAYLYKNSNSKFSAIDANYDLACLYFRSSNVYPVLSISNNDPTTKDDVIAIGTPGGQTNAVAFGSVLRYTQATLNKTQKYLSNVSFEVIMHNAYISRGSSGGPLIDTMYRIIGINYAGAEDNSFGLSVPASKIREFLNTYFYI